MIRTWDNVEIPENVINYIFEQLSINNISSMEQIETNYFKIFYRINKIVNEEYLVIPVELFS